MFFSGLKLDDKFLWAIKSNLRSNLAPLASWFRLADYGIDFHLMNEVITPPAAVNVSYFIILLLFLNNYLYLDFSKLELLLNLRITATSLFYIYLDFELNHETTLCLVKSSFVLMFILEYLSIIFYSYLIRCHLR